MPSLDVHHNALSAEHTEIIRATLPAVGAAIGEITPNFYKRMFQAHPDLLAHTFNRGNQAQGAQQKALAASVATFATCLIDPSAPAPEALLSRIGHKHVSVGIRPEQYAIVHEHLFDAIEEVLTPEVFQGEVRAAWDAVYKEMERVLVDFELGIYGSMNVDAGDVFRTVRVLKREELDHATVRFTFDATFDFEPGQYISVRQELADAARQLRQYSLVGKPGEPLSIVVRRVDDEPAGEVSTKLWNDLHEGDEVEISLPAGDLVLTESGPVVLVSSGIGATPMVGMLAALAGNARQVQVYHQDRSEAADVLRADRERYIAAIDGAQHHVAYSPDRIEVTVPEGAHVFICGGTTFLQAMRAALIDVPVDHLHFELFHPNDWLLG